MTRGALIVLTSLTVGLSGLAPSRLSAAEAPFETRLMRLAEVLGSLHYLRNLCGERSNQWRDEMESLLQTENPQADIRARYVASFNRGYRTFGASYSSCTESAHAAIDRYMAEGQQLARDIAVRYGN